VGLRRYLRLDFSKAGGDPGVEAIASQYESAKDERPMTAASFSRPDRRVPERCAEPRHLRAGPPRWFRGPPTRRFRRTSCNSMSKL
jgi:hypothetical protein